MENKGAEMDYVSGEVEKEGVGMREEDDERGRKDYSVGLGDVWMALGDNGMKKGNTGTGMGNGGMEKGDVVKGTCDAGMGGSLACLKKYTAVSFCRASHIHFFIVTSHSNKNI